LRATPSPIWIVKAFCGINGALPAAPGPSHEFHSALTIQIRHADASAPRDEENQQQKAFIIPRASQSGMPTVDFVLAGFGVTLRNLLNQQRAAVNNTNTSR
jgi:hypothetical protein